MDITYGDTIFIIATLQQLKVSARKLPRTLYTDFIPKLLSHECSNLQAHTLAGIAVGWSNVANGLQVYNPITKELYTTSIFKIHEHNTTKSSLLNITLQELRSQYQVIQALPKAVYFQYHQTSVSQSSLNSDLTYNPTSRHPAL